MEIGAQLYTVRDFTKNLNDFSEALQKIADIGYTTVQVSATCAFEPEWLEEQLKRTGLTCSLTHVDAGKLLNQTEQVVNDHKVFRCSRIGLGSVPNHFANGHSDYLYFKDNFKAVGKKLAEMGCLLMYHNHNFEFARYGEKNDTYLDKMTSDFTPEELGFTLDTYWVQAGGGDPAQWINKLAGRVPCVHVKDMVYAENGVRMAPVGEGNMNISAVLEACRGAGTQYLFVEQDDCYGADPFECLKTSYQNLKSLGV